MIKTVEEFRRSKTDISSSLAESIEVMKGFDKEKMKMIVLLTDGNFDDRLADEKSFQDIVNQRLSPREDVVVNTVGLGDEEHDEILNSITSKTGGEYCKIDDLQALLKALSHFSKSTSENASVIFEE